LENDEDIAHGENLEITKKNEYSILKVKSQAMNGILG